MERRVNLIDLKNLLRAELKIHDEKKTRYENALYEKDIYSELIGNLTLDDLNSLESNIFSLSLLLPLIYDEGKVRYLEQEFYKVLYLIKRLEGNRDLKDEYESAVNKLKGLVNSIVMEHNILCNKIVTYQEEYKSSKKVAYEYRGGLYKLNTGLYISDKQIATVKNILIQSGYSHEEQIVLMELLNHHNIKAKFNNPIISYTTIRMIESDFEDYELGELDKTKKAKLDECANSVFDAIMYSDDDKKNFEVTIGIISLMSEEEKEYVLRKTLNIFLNFLRECKNDMLEDNSYEDIELRKMIIHEYNSYYYKYKALADYYNSRNVEFLEEDENLNFGGGYRIFTNYSKKQFVFC